MFRRFLNTQLATEFLKVRNPIIAKRYPEEARNNEEMVTVIMNTHPNDKYMVDVVASYMGVKLRHQGSHEIFRIFNSRFHDERGI